MKTSPGPPQANVTYLRVPQYPQYGLVVTTCKCHTELVQNPCVEDRLDTIVRIRNESDRIAAPNAADPWLRRLDFDPATGRARRARGGLLVRVRRRAANNKLRNACRCGRDVAVNPPLPLAPAGAFPHAVVQCTACSGIVIGTAHPRVTNFLNGPFVHLLRSSTQPPAGGAPAPNLTIGNAQGDMTYGRLVPWA